MILVDSLYINNSGGLELLKYLVEEIERSGINSYYLFDERSKKYFSFIPYDRKCILKASTIQRYIFYKNNRRKFDKILCFGNIPPLIKTDAKVYTYFHNIFLAKIPYSYSLKSKFIYKLKRNYISIFKKNTNFWIVQTTNTMNALISFLNLNKQKILIMPFYRIDKREINNNVRSDYVYIANYNKEKNHDILIDAWKILYNKGIHKKLHLTLSDNIPDNLKLKIKEYNALGIKIINHGYISKDQVYDLYSCSKATIYPSFNESLGLGIIEAIEMGCDLIAPNKDYINSISYPSISYEKDFADDIVEAVLKYEKGNANKTILKINNNINGLIELLK